MTNEVSEKPAISRIFDSLTFKLVSIVAAVVTLISFVLFIPPVQNRVFRHGPRLEIQTGDSIPVVGFNQQVDGLNIQYQGKDLVSSGQRLVSSSVILQNTGNSSITPSDMSELDPIGFSIKNGSLLKITGFAASNAHLMKFGHPLVSGNVVAFNNNIIIDHDDFIDLRVLILEDDNEEPIFSPLGKISGQNTINISPIGDGGRLNLFNRSFSGSIGVQVARVIFYPIMFFGILVIVFTAIYALEQMRESKNRKQRHRISNIIRPEFSQMLENARVFVLELYASVGLQRLRMFYNRVNRNSRIIWMKPNDIFYADETKDIDRRANETVVNYVKRCLSTQSIPGRFRAAMVASNIGLFDQETKNPTDDLKSALVRLITQLELLIESGQPVNRYEPNLFNRIIETSNGRYLWPGIRDDRTLI